jgi:hypothetical protein
MSFASPRLEPEPHQPTQYTEPLPDWVREELAAHRDKLPELRQAICSAIAKSKGVLAKGDRNKEQGYFYTGYDAILEAVRDVMAGEGITIEHVTCDIEAEIQFSTRNAGAQTIWKWRAVCLVTHVSGASVVRIVRAITPPSNKAAGIARTAIDRILLTSLMRIAGGKDDQAAIDDYDRRSLGGDQRNRERTKNNAPGKPPAAAQPGSGAQNGAPASSAPKAKDWTPAELEQAKAFAEQVLEALKATISPGRMVTWARVVNGTTLPKLERERLTEAWRKRAEGLGVIVEDLRKDTLRLGPLPWARVVLDAETGDMHDKLDGTLL